MSGCMKGVGLTIAGLLLLSVAGCIIVGSSDCGWGFCGRFVWTEAPPERLNIDSTDLKALKALTHNGAITVTGQTDSSEAYVIVTKRGGGLTQAQSEEALAAIEAYVEDSGSGGKLIAWRWKGEKRRNWGADVGFDITVPSGVHFEGDTYNGRVTVKKVTGDVKVLTHNGEMNIQSTGAKLYVETYNGEVDVAFTGKDITVITHNGEIEADLRGTLALSGSITSHNGGVELILSDATSTKLDCRTHNGDFDCDVPLSQMQFSRHQLRGTVGSGDGELAVTTHNGAVEIKRTTG